MRRVYELWFGWRVFVFCGRGSFHKIGRSSWGEALVGCRALKQCRQGGESSSTTTIDPTYEGAKGFTFVSKRFRSVQKYGKIVWTDAQSRTFFNTVVLPEADVGTRWVEKYGGDTNPSQNFRLARCSWQ